MDVRGHVQGMTLKQLFFIRVLSWIPLIGAVVVLYKYRLWSGAMIDLKSDTVSGSTSSPVSHSLMSKTGLPKRFVGTSICIGYLALMLPLWGVLTVIPKEITPFWGWLLTYEWAVGLHLLIFGLYLKYCYETGKKTGAARLPTFKVQTTSLMGTFKDKDMTFA